MEKLKRVQDNATEQINEAHDKVTKCVREVLIKGGIPEEIANHYSALYCGGGEWILDDDNHLADEDVHLLSEQYIVDYVKEL